MNRKFIWMLAAASLTLFVAACDEETTEDEGCMSNDDCATGEICMMGSADGSGDGSGMTAANECVAVDCITTEDCTGEGEVCTEDYMCEVPEAPAEWVYVAIVSETTTEADINETTTPGPDIDAIELSSGGESFFADFIEAEQQGEGGEGGTENNFTNVATVLDENDAIPTEPGDCNLENIDGEFWSMGDETGYVVISFLDLRAMQDGDVLTVWELDDVACENVDAMRDDAYGVYIGTDDVDPMAITGVEDIVDNWLNLGSSPAAGGVTDFTVSFPTE